MAHVFLWTFQSAFWQPREQYELVRHLAQTFKELPSSDCFLLHLEHCGSENFALFAASGFANSIDSIAYSVSVDAMAYELMREAV